MPGRLFDFLVMKLDVSGYITRIAAHPVRNFDEVIALQGDIFSIKLAHAAQQNMAHLLPGDFILPVDIRKIVVDPFVRNGDIL